jgi:hypothetical protein
VSEALRGQRQHHLVNPGQTPLPLLDDLRLEVAGHITRDADLDRADVGQHGLGPAAVAAVAAVLPGRVVLLIAEVVGDLALQRGLQNPLGQLLQQPALTGQLEPLAASSVHQHRDQLLVRHRLGGQLLPELPLDDGLIHLASLLDQQIHR